jgi:hypothetical protein
MRLFEIDENFQVGLNKVWISLIPEFNVLLRRDKGSEGDYRGDKKLKARREFTFIYFDLDFTSPIREWDEYERREEAMKYAGLSEADLDDKVMEAHSYYKTLLEGSSRSLKTLKAIEKSLDQLDEYFENIDFSERDKKGEPVHSANQYLTNLEKVGKSYAAVEAFKKRVAEELKGEASIRGSGMLGRKESTKREWGEKAPSTVASQTSFGDIANLLTDDEDDNES